MNMQALDNKGDALLRLGKYNQSLQVLDNSLLINASDPTVLTYKAFDLGGLGKYNQSIVFLDKALAKSKKPVYISYERTSSI